MQPSVYASKILTLLLTNLSDVSYTSQEETLTMVAKLLFIELDEQLLEQILLPIRYCQGNCHEKHITRLPTSPTATTLLQHVTQSLVCRSLRKGERFCVNIGCVLERYLMMKALRSSDRYQFSLTFLKALYNPSRVVLVTK